PHLDYTGRIKGNALKLLTCNAAYWRGDSNRETLQRIYGIAFQKKEELEQYLERIEEAKKRDHRKLGRELGLFAFRDEAPGFPFYLPKGMILQNLLIDYWRQMHKKYDYLEISTPQIMKRTLWETSGHWEHYKDNMYTTVIEDEDYAIKPMNCPGSILVYALEPHSYRDLPLRYGELGRVHRHELSGALHGMFRVRCFTQDDAHILLAKDQIQGEVVRITKLIDEVYNVFGLPYKIVLSTMPEDHIGTRGDWEKAEAALADAITSIGKTYEINPGDGAFYGPKLDFHVTDSLGRVWQCGTIQLDYQLPGRFDLEYTDSNSEKQTPVMIHRVVYGSIERFIGVITEHFAGAFPTWLSPVQVKILPVTDRAYGYADGIKEKLEALGYRVEVDKRNEKTGRKIRDAQMEKVPYMIVVGDRDMEAGTLAPRHRSEGDLGTMQLADFLAILKDDVYNKRIK
ncbi:MAG: threonine--tRNA ligase, partial [Firmicutes bacterium]|nr:threonine--tRNA ligase [Bacillota bacterium]